MSSHGLLNITQLQAKRWAASMVETQAHVTLLVHMKVVEQVREMVGALRCLADERTAAKALPAAQLALQGASQA